MIEAHLRHEARLLAEREAAQRDDRDAARRLRGARMRLADFRAMTPLEKDAEIMRRAMAEVAALARGIRAERDPAAPTVAELEAGIGGGA